MSTIFTMFGASFSLVILLMLALWFVYLFQRNAGVVDIGWGIGFILAAWAYFILGTGDFLKMLTITLMATIWAGRLTQYVWMRFNSGHEDPRYTFLRSQWGGDSNNLLFLMLFIFQGVLVVIISLPFFIVDVWSTSQWSSLEFWGIGVWLLGVVGEAFADAQLHRFIKDPANAGKVCDHGLWRYSRHPNYFFEIVIWVGFCLFALPTDWGSLAIISPVVMLILLLKITGIPLTEAHSLETKGDAYREYQEKTSAIIPWIPKK